MSCLYGVICKKKRKKTTFEKGYMPKWSDEIFSIERVLRRTPVVYNIKDCEGITINANFYENELQKIYP